jgi:phage repressor protein C with HTH and peptisase S24 domain
MFSHDRIWAAIDSLAERHSLSVSGLAKRAGLDPTTFNKSKRYAVDGRARWPSTESLSKIMEATGASLDEFMTLVLGRASNGNNGTTRSVPLLGFAQAGAGGFFDDGGFPVGQGWDVVEFPVGPADSVYALEVSGDSMLPLYRDGDVLIVEPGARVAKGDRVVVKTGSGEVMAKVLARQGTKEIELQSINPDHPDRVIPAKDVEWLARIVWASQ